MNKQLKNYGHFDPSFPCVCINFPDENIWNKYNEIKTLTEMRYFNEMSKIHPNWEFTNENLAKFLQSDFTGFSADTTEYFGEFIIKKYNKDALDLFLISSTHMHERRHFHDWLLCPNTSFVNAIKLSLCLNSRYNIHFLLNNTNIIPVPLTKWPKLNNSNKELILKVMSNTVKDGDVKIPHILDNPDFLKNIETVEKNYEIIDENFASIDNNINLHVSTIFEASAFCIQVQNIHDAFGEKAQRFVERSIQRQNATYDYISGYMFHNVHSPSKPHIVPNQIILKLITWCQLGSPIVDRKNSNPLYRLSMLNEYIKEYGIPKEDINSNDLYTKIDKYLRCKSFKLCLQDSLEHPVIWDNNTDSYIGFLKKYDKNYFDEILSVYKYINECRERLVKTFLEDTDIYTDPIKYDNNVGNWIEPPIIYNFQKPFYKLESNEIGVYNNIELYKQKGKTNYIKSLKKEFGDSFDYNIAKSWQHYNDFTDILFSQNKRDGATYEDIIDEFKDNGIQLFELFI